MGLDIRWPIGLMFTLIGAPAGQLTALANRATSITKVDWA